MNKIRDGVREASSERLQKVFEESQITHKFNKILASRGKAKWGAYGLIALAVCLQMAAVGWLYAEVGRPTLPLQRPLGTLKNVPLPGPAGKELAEFRARPRARLLQLGQKLLRQKVLADQTIAPIDSFFWEG
ncbi:hypothetical protein [Glaciimonas immobilis]|uniref:Uncharacterized protein n=1 Tax=Glaciimonas immobilis TaxID=728004 RepID=A0A840RMH6_9BURK|nr:hypothetical protein [Glaciimonas immobilis]KAF3999451.1 hypothetical protein HAV38_05905 [Glaciimonas immobilis]MBB5198963.1 hypothetical protein [Glaciimonas immobilis]